MCSYDPLIPSFLFFSIENLFKWWSKQNTFTFLKHLLYIKCCKTNKFTSCLNTLTINLLQAKNKNQIWRSPKAQHGRQLPAATAIEATSIVIIALWKPFVSVGRGKSKKETWIGRAQRALIADDHQGIDWLMDTLFLFFLKRLEITIYRLEHAMVCCICRK